MSNENNNSESIDLKSNLTQENQRSTEKNDDETAQDDRFAKLEEEFGASVYFMNAVNEVQNRHINLPLILIQFFSRYSSAQKNVFLAAALILVLIQGDKAWNSACQSTLLIGCLMAVLMIAFVVVTLKHIVSAVKDIWLLKKGTCSIGYLIVNRNDNGDVILDDPENPPLIAYKDCANMIRTMKISEEQYNTFNGVPILELFLDPKNPSRVASFKNLPRKITYSFVEQTFTQKWKDVLSAFFPLAMTVLFAMSMYMSYAAYTMLHQ